MERCLRTSAGRASFTCHYGGISVTSTRKNTHMPLQSHMFLIWSSRNRKWRLPHYSHINRVQCELWIAFRNVSTRCFVVSFPRVIFPSKNTLLSDLPPTLFPCLSRVSLDFMGVVQLRNNSSPRQSTHPGWRYCSNFIVLCCCNVSRQVVGCFLPGAKEEEMVRCVARRADCCFS